MIALTAKAESDLDSIFEHYQLKAGSKTAFAMVQGILNSLEILERFPGAGRPSPVPDVRELVLAHIPFIAPYRLIEGRVQVLRLLHQSSERPEQW
ncbi:MULTISPECIES: type II toxin-antitoxin system RelE/ParE family toxin [Pseudomonas]|uniref:type II toxin-antitoxin system RelE/ParE family toxin n=1 Tax=Pseudomonas TaxID=286 RepID=UPI00029AA270|nr:MULTISPECIES: type II toxin-antitoxin system RelE/ParE family toxin [Pseudomonas]MBS7598271.1 type II toxin-antitoxin system RelE/ParE family toxin [Pseudomonas sp. RC2C2]WSE83119.1 type II toxin-antitoxin system RelE/ParE family toxin [Pseudomonas donghuensis]